MCKGVVPKIEWYEEFKPKVKFRHSKKEIIESFKGKLQSISKNCYQVQGSNISAYYTGNVYEGGKLFTQGEKVKKLLHMLNLVAKLNRTITDLLSGLF